MATRSWPLSPVLAASALALALTLVLYLALREGPPAPEAAPGLVLSPAAFADLDGWEADDQDAALRAFGRSCTRMLRYDDAVAMGRVPAMGRIGDWRDACEAAGTTGPEGARAFFEARFTPWRVGDDGNGGLFTGYYEPVLEGALEPDGRFAYPLHRPPDDLIEADLGLWNADLAGRSLKGRVEKGRLVPYWSRGEIERGALEGRGLDLLWVDDPVAKFFLQIQGSGVVGLPDGRRVRVGYAGQNGRDYRAIGRDLIETGAIPADAMSMQAIGDWLRAHPDEAEGVMDKNPSYVFFGLQDGLDPAAGPLGAQGVQLEPGRSLAVDRAFIPLGAPLWLEAAAPLPDEPPLRRLVVAQDTGGAIKGPVRGDLFWGAGDAALRMAGPMKSTGRYYILLPKGLAPAG
ncbi:MAG: murein transglycosylase A [Geminicoccaceae bacterium]|nr:murein transglycosylase A [Geminicoccaceae bacterium]